MPTLDELLIEFRADNNTQKEFNQVKENIKELSRTELQQDRHKRAAASERHRERLQQMKNEGHARTRQGIEDVAWIKQEQAAEANASREKVANIRKEQNAESNASREKIADVRKEQSAEQNASKENLANIKAKTDAERFSNQRASQDIQRRRLQEQRYAREQRDRLARLRADQGLVNRGFGSWVSSLRIFTHLLGSVSITEAFRRIGLRVRDVSAEFERLRLGMAAFEGDPYIADRQLRRIRELAELPGVGFTSGIRSIAGLRGAGVSFELAERMIREISNVATLSGATQEDVGEALRQFRQVFSVGQFTQQDLRPILQRIPLLQRAFREEFGAIQSGEVNEAIKAQGLTITEAFDRVITNLEGGPRAPAHTLSNSMERLRDAFDDTARMIGRDLVPLLKKIYEFLINANKFIQSPVGGALTATTVGAITGGGLGATFGLGSTILSGAAGIASGIGGLVDRAFIPNFLYPGLPIAEQRKQMISDLRKEGGYRARLSYIKTAAETGYVRELTSSAEFMDSFDTEADANREARRLARERRNIGRIRAARIALSSAPAFGMWGSRSVNPLVSGAAVGATTGLGLWLGQHSIRSTIMGSANPFTQAISWLAGGGGSGRNNYFWDTDSRGRRVRRTIGYIGEGTTGIERQIGERIAPVGSATARFTQSMKALREELEAVNDVSEISAEVLGRYQEAQANYEKAIKPVLKSLQQSLTANRAELNKIHIESYADGSFRIKNYENLSKSEKKRADALREEGVALRENIESLEKSIAARREEAAAIDESLQIKIGTPEEIRAQMEKNRREFAEQGGFTITPDQARGASNVSGEQLIQDRFVIPGGHYPGIDLTPRFRPMITPGYNVESSILNQYSTTGRRTAIPEFEGMQPDPGLPGRPPSFTPGFLPDPYQQGGFLLQRPPGLSQLFTQRTLDFLSKSPLDQERSGFTPPYIPGLTSVIPQVAPSTRFKFTRY